MCVCIFLLSNFFFAAAYSSPALIICVFFVTLFLFKFVLFVRKLVSCFWLQSSFSCSAKSKFVYFFNLVFNHDNNVPVCTIYFWRSDFIEIYWQCAAEAFFLSFQYSNIRETTTAVKKPEVDSTRIHTHKTKF